jgi:ferredoxin
MTIAVEVDQEKCCSAGQCVMVAPAVFDQSDEDGTVVLLDAAPPESEHVAVREAAEMCPGMAITVHER